MTNLTTKIQNTENELPQLLENDAFLRSSRPDVFHKKGGALRNFAKSQESTCVRDSFLIKLWTIGLQLYSKRVSGTDVFQ